ncbi:myozenin-2 [Alosa sapidissima]|uniref:myozenin-2 n=1 Tax=Alosa sapidissima TaxID=34773 RepID=UPI001C08B64C|nr:myozenin-2 [Alosa sapidissima]
MPVPYPDMEKQRRQNILDASAEIEGDHFNLGKKMSIPRDVMMEELKLLSNRGSKMFHERLKRVERFTLENANTQTCDDTEGNKGPGGNKGPEDKNSSGSQVGISQPGKNCLVSTLKQTVARKGNPDVLAPGYSGPLTEVPHERFNVTIIPKSYSSPWNEEKRGGDTVVASISANLPELPAKLTPANYKCFNRAPTPFGGTAGSVRTFPLPGFELNQAYTESNMTWERMCHRPNFNRRPQGWVRQYTPESEDL